MEWGCNPGEKHEGSLGWHCSLPAAHPAAGHSQLGGVRLQQEPCELPFRPWALGWSLDFCFCKLWSHFDFFDCKKKKKEKRKKQQKNEPKPNNPLPPSSPSELCTWLVKMMTEARCLLCFLASILAAANHGFTSSQCCTTLGCTQTPEGLTPGLLVPTAGQSLGSMFGFSWQH